VSQRLTMLTSKEHYTHIEAVSRFIEASQVAPIVDRTYPLAEVPDAMRHLEAGHARGKIAITI
jgi:NADPH:quinone reductase-like Zn-dependent oxidoreductase